MAKGGKIEDTVGRKCLCNTLLANIGHAQTRKDGSVEPALITVGDDLNTIAQFLAPGRKSYSAADVVENLLNLSDECSRRRCSRSRLSGARYSRAGHFSPPTANTFGMRSANAGNAGKAACGSVWYQYAVE